MTTEDADPLEDEPELAGLTQAGLGYIRDPYPEFARLREQSPVTRQEAAFVGGPPSYVVYSHEGVTNVLRDDDTYSSTIITEGMGQVWGPKIHRRHGRTGPSPPSCAALGGISTTHARPLGGVTHWAGGR